MARRWIFAFVRWIFIIGLVICGLVSHFAPVNAQESEVPPGYGVIYLPLIELKGQTAAPAHETYSVNWYGGQINALGGKLGLNLPQGAVNYPNCTLHVESENPSAEWLSISMYISCQVNVGEPPYYFDRFNFPVTVTMSYAGIVSDYLDTTQIKIHNGPVPLAESIVDQSNQTVSAGVRYTGSYNLRPAYTITDLASGPNGTVYAAAAPKIYTITPGSTQLGTLYDLSQPGADAGVRPNFTHFTVDPSSGTVFLALTSTTTSQVTVFAYNGNTLSPLYTLPVNREVTNLAYRPSDNTLLVAVKYVYQRLWGCTVWMGWLAAVDASSGELISESVNSARPYDVISVNSSGALLASYMQEIDCWSPGGPNQENYELDTFSPDGSVFGKFNDRYTGFKGAKHLASDDQGRTYISNNKGNAISVVAGPTSELVGVIHISAPGPLAVSNGSLVVISDGKVKVISPNSFVNTPRSASFSNLATLSGNNYNITLHSAQFDPVPAHNVLYYNGKRVRLVDTEAWYFNPSTFHATYKIDGIPLQPTPLQYVPWNQQTAKLEFRINTGLASLATPAAPEMPVISYNPGVEGDQLTVARGQWVTIQSYHVVSQDNLFEEKNGPVLYQFSQEGDYNFNLTNNLNEVIHVTVRVTPYGSSDSTSQVISPEEGGVLWASGAAFEIPPGALPATPGGYTVSFSTENNNLLIRDSVSEKSLVYKFSFSPQVTHLNKDIKIHIPRGESAPVMAFYDPVTNDPFPIDFIPEPGLSSHIILLLPAGDYPLTTTSNTPEIKAEVTPAAQPGWIRRGLNWLGSTGAWHAVGLPNDKLVTDRFVILFNSNDCSPSYAGAMLDAFEAAYSHFNGLGFTMPAEAVYVKIAPWVASQSTPGVTPGIGSLFHFYIFMNNALGPEYLQDTAVHEFMHVLQKTTATPDGRYMNPLWWEEATAIWAQYEMYPSHTGYYVNDIQNGGESWLRKGYADWNSMPTEQMNAAMSLAVYLQDNYGPTAVARTFIEMRVDWGEIVGVQKAIEIVTGKPFDQFYLEFAKEYWFQTFAPVDQWTFIDNITDLSLYESNAIYPVRIREPINTIFSVDPPQLSSGLLKIFAFNSNLPPSFSTGIGSVARITNPCTGTGYYYYDSTKAPIADLAFEGAYPLREAAYYDQRLGALTYQTPIYLLYVDNSYNYSANCAPRLTLETPTLTSVSPDTVRKNETVTLWLAGDAFGSEIGSVMVGGQTITPISWNGRNAGFTWYTGTLPGTVTAYVFNKQGARSNGLTITITD